MFERKFTEVKVAVSRWSVMYCSLAWNGTNPVWVGLQHNPQNGLCVDLCHPLREPEGECPQQAGKENKELGPH